MKIACPKCGSRLDAGSELSGPVECPSCGETIDMEELRSATCPICCSPFTEEDEVRICPDCRTPHHVECWEDNRGCSTYGCGSAQHEETHTSESADGSGLVPCPACGAMHPATDLVCAACGKLLDDKFPDASVGSRFRNALGRMGNVAKTQLWPRLARNLRLLGIDAAAACRLWWNETSRLTVFAGRTGRKEFWSFTGINLAATLFLLLFDASALVWVEWIALAVPAAAACVRRLRDTDISPWMVFAIPLLPFLLLVPSVETAQPFPSEAHNGDNPS